MLVKVKQVSLAQILKIEAFRDRESTNIAQLSEAMQRELSASLGRLVSYST